MRVPGRPCIAAVEVEFDSSGGAGCADSRDELGKELRGEFLGKRGEFRDSWVGKRVGVEVEGRPCRGECVGWGASIGTGRGGEELGDGSRKVSLADVACVIRKS